ncbi:MAG TPA: hypothetical protein PK275_08825 [Chitinophagaceae bacterium]|nr:hypothetical protein [Chitinophagaceae bacterium]
MKKFFAIAFVAVALASCGNSAKSDKPAGDSTKPTVDTPAVAPTTAPTTDSTNVGDTTKKADSANAPK